MEAAVTFLLETLRDEAVSVSKKLRAVREQIGSLRDEIVSFKANLEMWTKQPTDDPRLKALMKRYREAVYEAEDIVDDYVVEKANYKSKSWPKKIFNSFDYHGKLLGVAEKIQKIIADANTIGENWNKVEASLVGGEPSNRAPLNLPMVDMNEESNVVGFETEQEKVINLLTGGSDKLEVISIVGMPGLGKTTLAKVVFHNPELKKKFEKHIWVYVSKDCIIKEVFLTILNHFIDVDNDIRGQSIDILVQKVRSYLNEVAYLIVMDDVWDPKNWENLKTAFPNNNNKSRILLTSRYKNVAKHANLEKDPVLLEILNDEKSWELLKRKAFGSKECPDDLIEHGKNIAIQCRGLPLAIVVLGGVLLEKGIDSSGWEAVSKDVGRYISGNRFIDLSFYQLRYPVKACFLYFGMFLQGSEIPVKKLISLWIAEGFIQQEGKSSLEDIAKEYLDELVSKSLVMTKSRNGKIKTCYVHDVMHKFCKEKAEEENLYHEVENTSDSPAGEYHRICIHSSVLQYIISEQVGGRVRSFLCSSPGDITLESTHIIYPLKKYKLLRVFDGTPIIFPCFPSDLAQLLHLRYLVLHMRDKTLPESVSHLWNLQSLIIHSSSRTLEIQGDTRKMTQLRQLKTKASTTWKALSKTEKKKLVSSTRYNYEHLRKLSMISLETCTKDAFERVPNLNKLGIRGQLSKLFEVEGGHSLFDSVVRLSALEELKLFNDPLDPSHPESRTIYLPAKFPGKLKKLTLIGIQLDPENVSTLEMLENLEILKVKDIKFKFKEMKWVMKRGFLNLQILEIEKADFRFWEASADHFPKLRHLSLTDCTHLSEIPLSLASISSLETMQLERTTILAARSAEEIEKQKMLHHQTNGGKPFKLSINSAA